jgi:hypothetical protein
MTSSSAKQSLFLMKLPRAYLFVKEVTSFFNHTAACSQEATSFQERFTQQKSLAACKKAPWAKKTDASFVLGFNDRIP